MSGILRYLTPVNRTLQVLPNHRVKRNGDRTALCIVGCIFSRLLKVIRYDLNCQLNSDKVPNKLVKIINKQVKIPLAPVCCKKRQKIVPDQLLVCGVGDL